MLERKDCLQDLILALNGKPITMVDNIPINYFVIKESLKRGVLLRSLGNTIIVIPPLAIDSHSLNKIMDTQLEIVLDINKRIVSEEQDFLDFCTRLLLKFLIPSQSLI